MEVLEKKNYQKIVNDYHKQLVENERVEKETKKITQAKHDHQLHSHGLWIFKTNHWHHTFEKRARKVIRRFTTEEEDYDYKTTDTWEERIDLMVCIICEEQEMKHYEKIVDSDSVTGWR